MKILITGSNGLLGQKLVYQLLKTPGVQICATSKGTNRITIKEGYQYIPLDITDRADVKKVVESFQPDCIINTAAMTNVDACELDKAGCDALNVNAVRYLIEFSKPFNTHFIHLSTDFVFDGKNGPYKEDDIPNPLSYYASSKLESEKIVMDSGMDWAILRTIIIYGVVDDVQRSNLVLWTKSSLEQGKSINVITDQFRSPTLAEDLADACISAAIKRAKGIYHVSGPEEDLDSIINIVKRVADYYGLDQSLIKPVTSAELNQPAMRPPKTGFILDKARRDLGYKPHPLQEGLKIVTLQIESKQLAGN
ncbi:MAG TPA: SDR family oxidoreductase [Bacteroidia bacterium]|nr:SDR family oxidoreductase [Bacteroidia bacterium]